MEYSFNKPSGNINQTLEQFLAKYRGALDASGNFIPGKANLEYDGLSGSDVYNTNIGTHQAVVGGDGMGIDNGGWSPFKSEVNADWIEDPRAKGWIGQHPKGAAIIGTVLGGVGANMAGLLGSTATGASGGFVPLTATEVGGFGSVIPVSAQGAAGVGAGLNGLTAAETAQLASGFSGFGTAAGNAANIAKTGGLLDTIQTGASAAASKLGGAGSLAAIAGGLLGASGDLTKAENSTQNNKDTKIMQHMYGGLDDAKALYDQQKQNGGMNPLMQQGLNTQMASLNDPAYAQSYNQIRQAGQGLLGNPVAGNPFTTGQNWNMSANNQQHIAPQGFSNNLYLRG